MNPNSLLYIIEPMILNINEINTEMRDILSLFVFHQRLSTYQIHKIIEKHARKMVYMNTHKKVQKLIDLKLIEKVTDTSQFAERELEKGAKFYRLSEGGIFALFYYPNMIFKPSEHYVQRAFENGKTVEDMSDIFVEYKKEIFKNYQNFFFFELLLFPWISKETIERANEKLIDYIIKSLNECCTIVKNYVIKTSPPLYIPNDIDTVSYLLNEITGKQPIRSIESVNADEKNLLSVIENYISKSHMIVRIKRGNGKNNILMTSSFYPGRMILAYKDKENGSNIISFYRNTEGNSLFNYSLKHKQIIHHPMFDIFEERIDLESLYLKAVFSIVIGLSKDDDDLKLLKEDVKFMDTLSKLKERFHEGLELLAK
jgi:hypothetical protein